jgi:hypothetical protein
VSVNQDVINAERESEKREVCKSWPIKFPLIAALCEEMKADHKLLLLHSALRRLSRDEVLND